MDNDDPTSLDQTFKKCEISPSSSQSQNDSVSSLDDSLPCARTGTTEEMSSSPINIMVSKKKEVLQSSSIKNDKFHQIDLDDLDTNYFQKIGLKYDVILPIYRKWLQQWDEEDHEQQDLIEFIKKLPDLELSNCFTDDIIEESSTWYDEHGQGVINLIRYSIIDLLESKLQCPIIPFDTTHKNKWVEQDHESVRAGEMNFIRHLHIYCLDDHLNNSKEKDILRSLTLFSKNSIDEQIFFYHGTTEDHAQSIVSRGIRLFRRNSRLGNFGFGFYVTENLIHALRHAENRSMRIHSQQRPACLVFTMSKNEFNSHEIVHLQYEQKEEQITRQKMDESLCTTSNMFQWEVFVYQSLHDDPPAPLLCKTDAIIGPISANLQDIILGYKPIKKSGRPMPIQTAIISIKLAYALFDGLKGIII